MEKEIPEIVLGRRYFTITYKMWYLNHNGDKMGYTKKQFDDEMAVYIAELQELTVAVQKRFIAPRLKICKTYNLNASFNQWGHAWNQFTYNMSDEQFEKFEKLETLYNKEGSCEKYEKIKLSKKLDWVPIDYTDEEWAAKLDGNTSDYGENVEVPL